MSRRGTYDRLDHYFSTGHGGRLGGFLLCDDGEEEGHGVMMVSW